MVNQHNLKDLDYPEIAINHLLIKTDKRIFENVFNAKPSES